MRRRHKHVDSSLPWQFEAFFWAFGVLCIPAAMWWFVSEISSPASALSDAFGIPIDFEPIVRAYRWWIVLFGFLFGIRVRFAVRNWFVRKWDKL